MGRAMNDPVELAPGERARLEKLMGSGSVMARVITRARILLLTDRGTQGPAWSDEAIAEALSVTPRTMNRLRKRFAQERLKAIEHHSPKRYRPRRLDGKAEAKLITLACSKPPEGHAQWSLRLLADRLVSLDVIDKISYETVRRTLKKTSLSRGKSNAG